MARGPLKSTPFRLSLALVGLFTVVSWLSFSVSFFVAQSQIESTIRATLAQEMAGFAAAPSTRALSELVTAQGLSMDPAEKIISFTDTAGRRFGNGAIVRTSEGFEAIALDGGGTVAKTYFGLTRRFHDGYLTLAASGDALNRLRWTFTLVLLISLLPTAAVALGGGVVLARRSARRFRAVEQTLQALTGGDLSARVPKMRGGGDDLNRIASNVDALAAAQQANVAALRQVSADIAHDLKTPIQRVSVLLEKAASGGADGAAAIDSAIAETQGISKTFQSLLQIAQIEGGAPRDHFEPVDLGALVRDLVEVYGPSAEDDGHRITAQTDDADHIEGDRTLLGQVLANLIENALRHAGPGADVTVTAKGQRLIVADRGPGVPEAERAHVLRRLYRLETSRTTPGNGLGLSLVKVIADLHGARLTLGDNRPGLLVELDFAPHDGDAS